jgi:hypothetical protein
VRHVELKNAANARMRGAISARVIENDGGFLLGTAAPIRHHLNVSRELLM